MHETLRAAFLISGGGTTAEAAIKAWGDRKISGLEPVLVVSSNFRAEGLNKVLVYNKVHSTAIQTAVVRPRDYQAPELFGEAMLLLLHRYGVNLIAQLGYLAQTPPNVVEEYKDYIFNQHPAPLDPGRPDFGGTGMYGLQAHLALLIYVWLTGITLPTEATTHRVTTDYDRGDIIRRVPLTASKPDSIMATSDIMYKPEVRRQLLESALDMQTKLLPIEHANVIFTLQDFAKRDVPVYKREQPLISKQHISTLLEAKKIAVSLLAEK